MKDRLGGFRRLGVLALLLALIGGLAACAPAAPTDAEPVDETPAETAEVETEEPPTATEEPTDEPSPTPEPTEEATEAPTEEPADEPVAAEVDENCINCHADQEILASLATEPEAAAVESSGEG